eukprot:1996222-Pyramimonas_sp.AAC.1
MGGATFPNCVILFVCLPLWGVLWWRHYHTSAGPPIAAAHPRAAVSAPSPNKKACNRWSEQLRPLEVVAVDPCYHLLLPASAYRPQREPLRPHICRRTPPDPLNVNLPSPFSDTSFRSTSRECLGRRAESGPLTPEKPGL